MKNLPLIIVGKNQTYVTSTLTDDYSVIITIGWIDPNRPEGSAARGVKIDEKPIVQLRIEGNPRTFQKLINDCINTYTTAQELKIQAENAARAINQLKRGGA